MKAAREWRAEQERLRPRATTGAFPFPGHRTLDQVDRDEGHESWLDRATRENDDQW